MKWYLVAFSLRRYTYKSEKCWIYDEQDNRMYWHNIKDATQYQNKTPAEIVHQYKKDFRAKQGLLINVI